MGWWSVFAGWCEVVWANLEDVGNRDLAEDSTVLSEIDASRTVGRQRGFMHGTGWCVLKLTLGLSH